MILVWLLGHLWTLINSLVGLVFVLVSGRPGFVGMLPRGALLFEITDSWICRALPTTTGITFGGVVTIFDRSDLRNTWLIAHESRHVLQAMVLGPLYLPVYGLCSLWAALMGGDLYRDNAMEKDAQKAERS